ncbi:MAG: response regulator, partial [Desulfobacteraceae bacterium]
FTLKGSKDTTGSYKNGIKGTGYGLANVKKYVEQHQGTIAIASQQDRGTTVTITFPAMKKPLPDDDPAPIEEEKTCRHRRILLVEDELAISDVQQRILTNPPLCHRVDTAADGQAAMDLFEANRYDLVSLDYLLPGNISGMDIYRRIREKNQTVPILFVSGNLEFLESIKALQQNDPRLDHRSKPCQNREYLDAIHGLLRGENTIRSGAGKR